ncbi:MAG: response regulator [Rhizomicrobium sp.]
MRLRRPQLVVLDIWLQGSKLDGIQVLDTLKREQPDLPVVMISGHGTIETAVASIKRAPTTSSRSRSRPTASSMSWAAPSKPRACGARSRS